MGFNQMSLEFDATRTMELVNGEPSPQGVSASPG